jgi:hypothetical protein
MLTLADCKLQLSSNSWLANFRTSSTYMALGITTQNLVYLPWSFTKLGLVPSAYITSNKS